jgi:hypothetical protein
MAPFEALWETDLGRLSNEADFTAASLGEVTAPLQSFSELSLQTFPDIHPHFLITLP